MDTETITIFFKNLTIVVGSIYVISVMAVFFARDLMVSIQKKFFNFDEATIEKFLYGYIALFKILFIVLVVGPYISLLMM